MIRALILCALALFPACDEGGDDRGGLGASGTPAHVTVTGANTFQMRLQCDLQGVTGDLTMQVEVVSDTGITWGSGANPDITGVISTGDTSWITSGTVTSPVAQYSFTGRNQFADFVDHQSYARFRVKWVPDGDRLFMVINPFGPGPSQHVCVPAE
ncbi:MAG: hypothetical protein ACE366_26435 [Bradymonadia bacterium]